LLVDSREYVLDDGVIKILPEKCKKILTRSAKHDMVPELLTGKNV
jgi:hypothetical protein